MFNQENIFLGTSYNLQQIVNICYNFFPFVWDFSFQNVLQAKLHMSNANFYYLNLPSFFNKTFLERTQANFEIENFKETITSVHRELWKLCHSILIWIQIWNDASLMSTGQIWGSENKQKFENNPNIKEHKGYSKFLSIIMFFYI